MALAPGLEEQSFKGHLSVCCAPGDVTRKRRRGREEEQEEEEEGVGESEEEQDEDEEASDLDLVMSLVCSREGFGVCTMMKRGKNHRTR